MRRSIVLFLAAVAVMMIVQRPAILMAQQCGEPDTECGDMDNSGSVASTDALRLLKHAIGTPGVSVCCPTCPLPTCGDGVVEGDEDCDFGDLDGETCATQGLFGDGLACGTGCVFDTSGCSATRYDDTGLGSVIDHETGLEWQKTDDAGGLTDKDNEYTWSAADPWEAPTGTAFTEFLGGLNGGTAGSGSGPTTGCYAGHCDWRMPVIEELTTIVDCSFGNPCIDQSAFGPTVASPYYWSSSSRGIPPASAWGVFFDFGFAFNATKDASDGRVRAVRGGS